MVTIPLLLVTPFSRNPAPRRARIAEDLEGRRVHAGANARGRSGPCGSSEEDGRTTPNNRFLAVETGCSPFLGAHPVFLEHPLETNLGHGIRTVPGAVSCPCGGRTGLLYVTRASRPTLFPLLSRPPPGMRMDLRGDEEHRLANPLFLRDECEGAVPAVFSDSGGPGPRPTPRSRRGPPHAARPTSLPGPSDSCHVNYCLMLLL